MSRFTLFLRRLNSQVLFILLGCLFFLANTLLLILISFRISAFNQGLLFIYMQMFLKDKFQFQLMKYLLNVFATLFWSVVIFPFFQDTNYRIGAIPSSFGVLVFTLISSKFFLLVLSHLGLIFIV